MTYSHPAPVSLSHLADCCKTDSRVSHAKLAKKKVVLATLRTLALASTLFACQAMAQSAIPVISLSDGRTIADVGQIAVAERGALEDVDGTIRFAGQDIALKGFSGVLGFSSDVAYLIVARGSAGVGRTLARPGQVVLFGAYGAKPLVSRFDAGHYASTLPEAAKQWAPKVAEALASVGATQKTAFFFGLYRRDGVLVPTRGETARQKVLGAASILAARFSGEATPEQVEYDVITMLARALVDRDAAKLAPLIDPLQFGGAGIDASGEAARLTYAQTIIDSADWPMRLNGVAPVRMSKPGVWVLQAVAGPTFVTLRPTRDFVFIQSVQTGETR